jgi:threonine/homoserine/homoserine lactone efflux protein
MTYLPHLLALFGAWVVFIVSPGPSFATTAHYATTRSRNQAITVALGVTCGIAIWLVCSLLGLSILFTRFSALSQALKVAGAIYLAYLGVKLVLSTRRAKTTNAHATASVQRFRTGSPWNAGLLTTLSNPKVVVFFSSIFAVFAPTALPMWTQAAMIALLVSFVAGWYLFVACIFSLGPITKAYYRARHWIDRCTGGIFLTLSLLIVVAH